MDPDDRTFLITGSTDGHGLALARRLAAEGGRVLLHGRDRERLERARSEVATDAQIEPLAYRADLASLDEVRELAARVTAEHDALDVLVNNAGIAETQRRESADGHELDFAVNYLSHYLLTLELLPLLEAGREPRIVNVSSLGQQALDFDDVMLEDSFDPWRAYSQSKLAQIMFTIELAERFDGRPLVNSLHPSTFMDTKLVRGIGAAARNPIERGVEATMRLAVSEELDGVSGRFFDVFEESAPDPQALDPRSRARLLELSERLTGAAIPGA